MKFALTGDQPNAALFAGAIAQSSLHSLVRYHISGPLEERLRESGLSGATRVDSAESVLISTNTDGVIVAASDVEESIRLVRQASQAGYHVVVVPPDSPSPAFGYELHLLLDESQHGIIVLSGSQYLDQGHPVPDSPMDSLLGLPAMTDDLNHSATLVDGIDITRCFGFADGQVTVLGINEDGTPSQDRQIVLSDNSLSGRSRPTVTLKCSRAAETGRLTWREGDRTVESKVILPGLVATLSAREAQSLCERVCQRLSDSVWCQSAMERYSQTLQVAAAIDKSIRRRRTVDISMDELTERAAFKTQMTAIGCGVLTWLFLGLVGYLLIGQLFKLPERLMLILRGLWILPVVLYLIAQFLLPIARGRGDESES
jgi:hypothetical protein